MFEKNSEKVARRLAKKQNKKVQRVLEIERKKYHREMIIKEKDRVAREVRIAPEGSFLSLRNVNKIYDNHVQAVFDFNLDVKEKEFIVLVGPSGCGKSTTLRMIAGLEQITAGDLFINGEIANDLLPKERDIAMVFQSYALYPHMTVKENMGFGLKINRYPKDEIERRVAHAAEILQLEPYLNRKPGQLSGGQCQRVALGRAIVRNSKLFLMDEPLSNLDAKLRVSMRSELVKLHQRLGATTVYVTHDQTEAMTMATRVVVMDKGYIKQVGTPSEIYQNPDNIFVATFIGSPAMNMYQVKYEKGNIIFKNGSTLNPGKDFLSRARKFYRNEARLTMSKIDEIKDRLFNRYVEEGKAKAKKGTEFVPEEGARDRLFNDASIYNIQYQQLIKQYQELEALSRSETFELEFGVRAENVSCQPAKEGSKVTVAELLGSEYFVHFDFSDTEDLVCKANAKETISVGDIMVFEFDKDMIYLFDPITQNRIR